MLSRQTWFALFVSAACLALGACVGDVDGAAEHKGTQAELDIVPVKATPVGKVSTPVKEVTPIKGGVIKWPRKPPAERVIFMLDFATACPKLVAGSGWVGGDMFPLKQGKPEVVSESGQRFCAYKR
jgi:hypothetical protein